MRNKARARARARATAGRAVCNRVREMLPTRGTRRRRAEMEAPRIDRSILARANASRIVVGARALACVALVVLFQFQGYVAKRHNQQLQEKRQLVAALRKDREIG